MLDFKDSLPFEDSLVAALPRAFAIEAVVLLLFGLLFRGKLLRAGLDLQIHNTYFVVAPTIACLGMSALLGVFAATYSLVLANRKATAWHFWITTVGVILFWISFLCWGRFAAQQQPSQYLITAALTFAVATLMVMISPVMFLANVGMALLRHR